MLPVSRPKRLAQIIRHLLASGVLLGGWSAVRAELPVPSDVAALANHGNLASFGSATAFINGPVMTINQTSDKATLDWKSFNIGPGNTVRFEQPASTSVALNNIHQSDPSRIFGTLTANGQVYLINQNGFVFGPNSQVNVSSFVASSLNISQDTLKRGLAVAFEPDTANQRHAALEAVDADGNPVKQLYLKDALGQAVLDQSGQKIKIQIKVEAGALIKTNAADGRIILAAPSVTNRGGIEAPGGQVIIAASQDKVYLQVADSASGNRGYVVEVGTGGDIHNIGKVLAETGNASLIGFAVNQQGIVSATTSVNLNGSVRLLAREGIQDPVTTGGVLTPLKTTRTSDLGDGLGVSANVTLAPGSLSSVDLDTDKSQTAIDSQQQVRSNIEISGHNVVLQGTATVKAKSGNVSLNAIDNLSDTTVKGNGRIYLDSGSRIDVSGVQNVTLPMERNVLAVELRNNELRDAPLQRTGILHGKIVGVDLRMATIVRDPSTGTTSASIPIADISGALARIARNIDERSITGGSISLNSSGDIITRPGSVLDFSGGSVAYQDGYIATTKLMDAQGQIFDISKADPNRIYTSIFGLWKKDWTKWGITEEWSWTGPFGKPVFEKGYVDGAAAGSVNINAFNAMLDGILKGGTVNGKYQRLVADRPAGGELSIDLSKNKTTNAQDLVFAENSLANSLGLQEPLALDKPGSSKPVALKLDTGMLKQSGLSNLTVKTYGAVKIPLDARLSLPAEGKLSLSATQFDVLGSIITPGGSVTLNPISTDFATPINLGKTALIDVSGRWANDWLDTQEGRPLGTVSPNGGSVSLTTEQADLRLEKGSRIDVSGGAWLQADSKIQAGKAGSINLVAATNKPGTAASSLILKGELAGWAMENGGSLSLRTNEVVIGSADNLPARPGSKMQPLLLDPGFFQQGGFASYDLGSNVYGLKVADGIPLTPMQRNLKLPADPQHLATGAKLAAVASVTTLPDALRNPASLSLSFVESLAQNRQESLSIGKGASIKTDPKGSVSLTSDTSVFMDGSIEAPAGSIAINVIPAKVTSGFFASQGIWLGSGSRLSAAGVFKPQPDGTGLRAGEVLPGGAITLSANHGYIVSQSGSLMDVSGTSATLDSWQSASDGSIAKVAAETIASSGGSISLTGAEGILADGRFNAQAGGSGAAGGSLSVELNSGLRSKPDIPIAGSIYPDDINPNLPRSIIVSAASTPVIPAGLKEGGDIPSAAFNGKAWLTAGQINSAGFSSLTLKTDALSSQLNYVGSIVFQGDVTLKTSREIILDSPSVAWTKQSGGDSGTVRLDTAYAALGSTISRQDKTLADGTVQTTLAPEAVGGTAALDVQAQGIDLVGGLSLNGFGQVGLNSQQDVRMIGIQVPDKSRDYRGEMKVAGNLTIQAAQVYPTTLTDYMISAAGQNVAILGNGNALAPVLSAGGRLTINAANISQAGILKAPFGALSLNASNNLELAAGSLTSVSGAGLTIPFGVGSGGLNWLYPLDGTGTTNLLIGAPSTTGSVRPPEKQISLNGKNLALRSGAKIDLSGGGDLYAYEFLPGSGGSNDVLDPRSPGYVPKFAVLPGIQGIQTPYDPFEFSLSGLRMGASVYLSGVSGLPTGQYALLPAHYALLPGAYLITPRGGMGDWVAGQSSQDLAGITVVAGRYGVSGTAIQDPLWQGFAVESGSVARTRSEFKDYSANQFFADQYAKAGVSLPSLPMDGGNLSLSATSSMSLGARLFAAPAGKGSGGQVDISADRLAIIGRREDAANLASGIVSLLADELNQLGAPSLLLGGKRSQDKNGQRLTVATSSLDVLGDVVLQGQEILLAASKQITLESGALLESVGKSTAVNDRLLLSNANATNSDGAFLRVSANGQSDVVRDKAVTGNTGLIVVEQGAQLKAQGSMLLDSTKDTQFDGDILMQGGALALKSSKISIGAAPIGTTGLVLSKTGFVVDELKLTSASDINLYGAVDLTAGQLDISAAAIIGYANAGSESTIKAGLIRLDNARSVASASSGQGTGTLTLDAQAIQLGVGNYAIRGFQQVALNASGSVIGLSRATDPLTGNALPFATGQLTVAGDLTLNTPLIQGQAGATTAINASDHSLTINSPANSTKSTGLAALGASWALTADSISNNAVFDLPSGILHLTALQGDLSLNAGTVLDVSGRVDKQNLATWYSDGGNIFLEADKGSVHLASDSTIKLQGAMGEKNTSAGLLDIRAAKGAFDWNGQILAGTAGNAAQGQLVLDVLSLGNGDLSALSSQLARAGFTEALNLTQASGNVVLASDATLKAHHIQLSAEQGAVDLLGLIDASGPTGGTVSIYGRNGISIGATGQILAKANSANANGGSVTLDTVHRDDSGSGQLDLAMVGGLIDVSAGAGGLDGAVHLRTGRNDADGSVNLNKINGVATINTTLNGVDPNRSNLEAARVYTGIATIDDGKIQTWRTDTHNFIEKAKSVSNHSGSTLNLAPGIEVRSTGNLTLADTWDFMQGTWMSDPSGIGGYWQSNWRYNEVTGKTIPTGFLTLRAGQDLNINASLTDAFATSPIPGVDPQLHFRDVLQPGLSWSFNLIANGNVNLANSYQAPDIGDPFGPAVANQVVVRTGTGNIDINAGKDIKFVANANNPQASAAVYTMGTTAKYDRYDLLNGLIPADELPPKDASQTMAQYLTSLNVAQLNTVLRYGLLDVSIGGQQFLADYPNQGGSIGLQAGGSIYGIQTGQLMTDWLVRTGSWSTNSNATANTPTGWGINISGDFNFDSLGIDVDGNYIAGRGTRFFNQNIGALGGGDVVVEAGSDIRNLSVMIPTTGKPLGVFDDNGIWKTNGGFINGGGNLLVRAGNDIQGGEYYVGQGVGQLRAYGGITDSADQLGAVLELGNAQFLVESRKDLNLGSVLNPTVLPQLKPFTDPNALTDSFFFTYGTDSSVNVASMAGNVVLENSAKAIRKTKNLTDGVGSTFEFTVYPGTLKTYAFSGDIVINGPLTLFPSAKGQLELLANDNVFANGILNMSDADSAFLPNVDLPAKSLQGSVSGKIYLAQERLDPTLPVSSVIHAATPVHQGNSSVSTVLAQHGDIVFPTDAQITWYFNQASNFVAGRDILNLSLIGQNLAADDVTILKADRDILSNTAFNKNGTVLSNVSRMIEIGGPGQLQVLAGRDINLGSSDGIKTVGNQRNPAINSSTGAEITVAAGLSNTIDFQEFFNTYQGNPEYSQLFEGFLEKSGAEQRSILLKVLFNEIKLSASAAAVAEEGKRAQYYKQGFDAINTLFSGEGYEGDLALVFSQIKTLAGGNINLLAPGGKIDVGLAGKNGGISKSADKLGIIVQQGGNLNSYSAGNFNVNQSRVFTMGGGDVVVWSSQGSIDAGKGAKSAISAPPPIPSIDSNGNPYTIFPPIISGSGIQAISSSTSSSTASTNTSGSNNALSSNNLTSRLLATNLFERVRELKYPEYSIYNTTSVEQIRKQIDDTYAQALALWVQAYTVESPAQASNNSQVNTQLTGIMQSASALDSAIKNLQSGQILAGATAQSDQGNVYLAAPQGIVDAGEAGISGGKVVIAATAVIGASNIQSTNGTVGVPAAIAAPVIAPGADAAAASVAKSTSDQLSEAAGKPTPVDDKSVAKAMQSALQADVVGFGACSVSDVREGKSGCGG